MKNKLGFLMAATLALQVSSFVGAEETPLAVYLYPQNQELKEGETAAWYLTAAGFEPLQYQWKRNGVEVPGARANTFKIASVKSSDQGSYTCTVKNKFGAVETDPVQLSLASSASLATSQKLNVQKKAPTAAAQNIVKPEK